MKIKQILLVFVGVLAVSAVAFAAVLTPSFGILSAPVVARGSFEELTGITFRVGKGREHELIQVNRAQETVMQQVVIAPGGFTGWHSHPGPVIVLVKSGQLSFYDGEDPSCTVRTYSAGQAFVDRGQGHVHIGRNESPSENLELWSAYLDVPPGEAFRIDAPNPGNCSF